MHYKSIKSESGRLPRTQANDVSTASESAQQPNTFIAIKAGRRDRSWANVSHGQQRPRQLHRDLLLKQMKQTAAERTGLTQVKKAFFGIGLDGDKVIHRLRPFTSGADFYEKIEDPCVIQPEYRDSMKLGSCGVELMASYYHRKYAANIVVPKFQDGTPVSLERLPDVAPDLFGEMRRINGSVRCALLFNDGEQCVPLIYIKEKVFEAIYIEAILVADSRGGYEGDPAQILEKMKMFEYTDVYRVDAPRRSDKSPSDKALSWVEAVKFGATITGRRANSYILPYMVTQLSDRSKPSAIPGSDRVRTVTLPLELAKLSRLAEFIADQRKHDPDPLWEIEINRPLTKFIGEHQVTFHLDDGNGGSVPVQRIDWLRKKSLKNPDLMHAEFYNQQLENIYKWPSKSQYAFAQSLKNVRRGKPTPPPNDRVQT